MGRIRFLLIAFAAAAISSCSPLRFNQQPIVQSGDWTTDGGNQTRTNSATDANVTLPLMLAWTYNATAGFSDSSPLLIDGNIYLGNRKGEVHVLRASDGKRVAIQGFGNSIEASPVHHEGHLIVPNAWGKTVLKSYNLAQGRETWSYNGPPIEGGLIAYEKSVITSDIEGKIFSLNTINGDENWSYLPDSVAGYYSAPVLTQGKSIFADSDGVIRILDPTTGALLDTAKHGQPVYNNIAVIGDVLFVPGYHGQFTAYSVASLERKWTYKSASDLVKFGAPSIVKGLLVVGSTDGFIRAFDPGSGKLLWETQFDGAIVSAPLIMKDYISVGTTARELYLLDRTTGEIVWNERLRGRIKSAQLVAGEILVVMSEPKYVYGFSTQQGVNATN